MSFKSLLQKLVFTFLDVARNRLTLYATVKPQNNGPLYSNTVIGTLAVDGWAVTFGTARKGLGAGAPPSLLLAVPNVAAHPSTARPTSYYLMWHHNCLWNV